VAASAVQLTLGHETWKLDFFEDIVIHPSDFKGTFPGQLFSGETNMRGIIKLSWKKFIAGYTISDDNLNLGLHEFTHALRFSGIKGHASDYFAGHYFYGWLASAYEAYHDIRNNRETIFREYGGANITEFISVCIEHYFESPQEIRERYPLLYYSTAILLNQETVGGKTKTGIRSKAFEKKNALLPGYGTYRLTIPVGDRATLKWMLFVMGILLLKIKVLGFGDEVDLVFGGVLLLIYLRMDFKTIVMNIGHKTIRLHKGLFLWRGLEEIPVSQLVSVTAEDSFNYRIVYYNQKDSYFYEEKLYLHTVHGRVFEEDLKKNKVAVLKF
jgi:hypothetical protein